ncbi:hypothetical protein PHMEG_00032280 [Phytophthora megakarya]|uniref:DDE-1 domain-containing protein n=1 Tax=Phytophthora megakarya TaxID=4795 RepID=A0A225UWA9_9STRA|nr:hypothetical protein PHMEG_00032280 [Phytophthora megakarya]
MKASRWWDNRERFLQAYAEPSHRMSVQANQPGLRKHVLLKALPGRGRRRNPWTTWLHDELLQEFHRLRKAGLKMSPSMLVSIAQYILTNSHHSEYTRAFTPPGSDIPLYDRLNVRWVQTFQDRFNIVQRKQAGKKQLSPQKQLQIEKEVAFHMGTLKRGFESGEFTNEQMVNMDETHFIVDMDNGKTLSFKGDEHVSYADVVAGSTGMTMVVLLLGGTSAKIGTPMMIFSNASCSYPIRGVPDKVPGVAYRTAQKGFMTSKVFAQWLGESRVIRRLPRQQKMIIWADNYSGHTLTEQANTELSRLNAEVRAFPANATHLVQPADSFVISKIKDAWTKRWEAKKVEMIRAGEWQNTVRSDGSWSGALRNPGKTFYLQLAADAVRDVNAQRTKKGNLTYAQKAMVRCGLATVNGKWSVDQLSDELQMIIADHYDHFMGKPVEDSAVEDESPDQSAGGQEASV